MSVHARELQFSERGYEFRLSIDFDFGKAWLELVGG